MNLCINGNDPVLGTLSSMIIDTLPPNYDSGIMNIIQNMEWHIVFDGDLWLACKSQHFCGLPQLLYFQCWSQTNLHNRLLAEYCFDSAFIYMYV